VVASGGPRRSIKPFRTGALRLFTRRATSSAYSSARGLARRTLVLRLARCGALAAAGRGLPAPRAASADIGDITRDHGYPLASDRRVGVLLAPSLPDPDSRTKSYLHHVIVVTTPPRGDWRSYVGVRGIVLPEAAAGFPGEDTDTASGTRRSTAASRDQLAMWATPSVRPQGPSRKQLSLAATPSGVGGHQPPQASERAGFSPERPRLSGGGDHVN
jgi:hypothetical protein